MPNFPPAEVLEKMVSAAIQVRTNAYAPYSKYQVGAAILAVDGQIYAGCNVENCTYNSTCAERSAISAMVAGGGRKTVFVVVSTQSSPPAFPCGNCLQLLAEFGPDCSVLAVSADGKQRRALSLAELFPQSFVPEMLK